jgi:hypothetical protein
MGRGKNSGGRVTQGGVRSSLTLGYNHVIPTGFQFGGDEESGGGAEKVEGTMKIFEFRFWIFDLRRQKKGVL